MYGTPDI